MEMLVFEEKGKAELPQKNLSEQGRRSVDFGLEPRPHQSRRHSLLAVWSAGQPPPGQPPLTKKPEDSGCKIAATLVGYKSSQHFVIPENVRYES